MRRTDAQAARNHRRSYRARRILLLSGLVVAAVLAAGVAPTSSAVEGAGGHGNAIAGHPRAPGSAHLAIRPHLASPLRVLFVGDSLTNGYYATTRQQAFAEQVRAALSADGPVVSFTSATNGGTLSTVAATLVLPPRLDLAIVELGTNDRGRTDIHRFTASYGRLVASIRAASPDAALVCVGAWTTGSRPGDDSYDRAIEAQCEASGGRFASLAGIRGAATVGPLGSPTFQGDRDSFHPNDAGHAAIAEAIRATLALN